MSTGERWGRGPKLDLHSSNEARVDSPAWHLVQALNTLVGPDGHTPAIEGYADTARPISATEKEMVHEASQRQSELMTKQQLGVERWVHDVSYLEALKAHLAKHGFGDIEVNMTGGYDPTSTPASAVVVRAETSVYHRAGIDPILWPRTAGSWPGYVFTGDPLGLPAVQFGLGRGNGAHAPACSAEP